MNGSLTINPSVLPLLAGEETWRIEFQRMNIVKAQERSGDDPYVVTVGFRSRLMTKGSTRVSWSRVVDGDWAADSPSGTTRSIPPRQGVVRFPGVTRPNRLEKDLPEVIGAVLVSIEHDRTPAGSIRVIVDKLVDALERTVADLVENVSLTDDEETRRRKIEAAVRDVSRTVTPTWFEGLGLAIESGLDPDDVTGMSIVVFGAVGKDFPATGFPRLTESPLSARHDRSDQVYVITGRVLPECEAGWESLDATITSAPALSTWGGERLDACVRGSDAGLWHAWRDGGGWSRWESLGGRLTSAPAAVSWGHGRLDVVAVGTDKAVWHRWFEGRWAQWESLGGSTGNAPAICSWGPGRLDIFVRGDDGSLWQRYFDGAWSEGWVPLGGQIYSPAATSSRFGRIDILARTQQGRLVHRWFDHGWSGWSPLDREATAHAVFSSGPHELRLLTREGSDVFMTVFDGSSWTGHHRLGAGMHWGVAGVRTPYSLHVLSGTIENDLVHAETVRARVLEPFAAQTWKAFINGATTVDRA